MPIPNLTIIGESINDSVPSTNKLFEANDLVGLKELAKSQDVGGAGYIDVNVGPRTAEFLAEMVRQVQGVTAKPLSIDTPRMSVLRLPSMIATAAPSENPITPIDRYARLLA